MREGIGWRGGAQRSHRQPLWPVTSIEVFGQFDSLESAMIVQMDQGLISLVLEPADPGLT